MNYYYNTQEKEEYLNIWKTKLTNDVISYDKIEYEFYTKLSTENKYYNDIQREHYIDNGCLCVPCRNKRKNIFFRAKNGETIFEKIIHTDVVNEHVNNINLNIVNKVNIVNKLINKINTNKKNKNTGALKNNLITNVMNSNVNKKPK